MRKAPSTIRHLARALGVSTATVSLALRNQPGVAELTRARIKSAALRLGYHAKPLVSVVAAYARAARPATYISNLAYLCSGRTPAALAAFAGGKASAAERGYGLELFDISGQEIGFSRLERILLNRGISGVILDMNDNEAHLPMLDWSRFEKVVIGAGGAGVSHFHRVDFDSYSDMFTVITKAWQRGYHRLGFAENGAFGSFSDEKSLGAWALAPLVIPGVEFVPPIRVRSFMAPEFRAWFSRYGPEVVISRSWPEVQSSFQSTGIDVPGQVAFSGILQLDVESSVSCVHQDVGLLGATAVELLVEQIENLDQAEAENPKLVLSRGNWREGTTLPIHGPSPTAGIPPWLAAFQNSLVP